MGYCKLTGVELPEGQNTTLKKMCINCEFAQEHEDGTFACTNDAVMEKGRAAILASVPDGYEIETLTLKPMSLKNPLKKCGNYKTDVALVTAEINKTFQL